MSTPLGTPSDGYSKIVWVEGSSGLAVPSAPTVSECNGADDLSLYYIEFTPNINEDTAATPRVNTINTPVRPGRAQRTITTSYVSNPQSQANNAAELTLLEFLVGYYIERVGFPHAQNFSAGDIVNVYLVQLGRQNPSRAANTDWMVQQTAYVQDYWRSVEVVAS